MTIDYKDIEFSLVHTSAYRFSNEYYYPLFFEYQKELREVAPDICDEPIETEEQCVKHKLATPHYYDCFIYYKKQIIGLICYQDINFLKDSKEPIMYIDHFYIKPEYRHTGLAKAAMSRFLNAKANGYVIFFFVLNNNQPAQRFWDKFLSQEHIEQINDERCLITAEVEGEDLRSIKHIIKVNLPYHFDTRLS